MKKYTVVKYFGHFKQIWTVIAESEKDAWNNAEKNGKLDLQLVHRHSFPECLKGHVEDANKTIKIEEYDKWLKEAVEMGMILQPHEYERLYGLPFKNVW